MTTSFPSGLDNFTNPTSSDTLDSPDHAAQHADVNDAVEALQAKVGVDSSAVTTSHDYKITQLENGKLSLTGGTLTGTLTGTSIVATTGIDAGYVGKSITGAYTYITAWPNDGNWIAVNGDNGYLLLDGNYADDDIYLRTYNSTGRVNIGAGHSNTLGVDNGSITVSGTGYATNWSVGTGSSANAFVGGSNYWRPQDAYGNSYFDINSGQFYVDSDVYYFRNRASTNSLVIDSSGNGTFTGTVSASRLQVGGHYIDDVAGSGNPYGSINVGGAMSWDGYAIDQRVVFMHDGGSNWGIYNDVSNEWMVYGQLDGGVELRYNNTKRLWTDNSGGRTDGRHYTTGDNYAYAYYGHSNVAGTGNAIYTPNGIYSTGTNWLYGTLLTNGSDVGSSSQRIGQVWSNGWFRTAGQTGWYNDSYGGGVYMADSEYVRVYNNKAFWIDRQAGTAWNDSTLLLDTANGTASIAFHTGGVAPQFRVGHNYSAVYLRNSVDSGWSTLIGIVSNQSSRKDKQDISDFRNVPSSLSSDADVEYARYGLDLVKQLRPVSYRWKRDGHLDQIPLSERRANALVRLQRIRKKAGMEPFVNDEFYHLCGRDCDGSEEQPCVRVRDWQNGSFGFVAEEVGEVAPELGTLDSEGNFSSIDNVGLTAVAVAAIQELSAKVEALEAQLKGAS